MRVVHNKLSYERCFSYNGCPSEIKPEPLNPRLFRTASEWTQAAKVYRPTATHPQPVRPTDTVLL